MNSDHHFWIGTRHKVCEDYALSLSDNNLHVAIVCDGCSSSRNTDIGARLLARSALKHIDKVEDDSFGSMVISSSEVQARALGLPYEALNATLLVVVAYGNKYVARCYGDGAIALVKNDGSVVVNEYIYPSGAPRYLSYIINKKMYEYYIEQFGEEHIINRYDLNFGAVPDVTSERMIDDSDPFIVGLCDNLKCIALMSDGFGSFYKFIDSDTSKNMIEIPNTDIYERILGFKNMRGQFVERRAKKFISMCQKDGWMNGDDCSIAAINLEK